MSSRITMILALLFLCGALLAGYWGAGAQPQCRMNRPPPLSPPCRRGPGCARA
ncbi:hypothetical protein G3436_21490 [Pseudomonas sp. MAFF212427]|uniref:Uncharacterized protein n=1 Tax=Pseudomonas brassicae TaxID=2708063 RepID=A0A6B3NXV7_9PSED|nr:hypothetical protein [Pseudomonas brassicae]NER65971.1 hypothetical protein [Pseudomonas brassicae]